MDKWISIDRKTQGREQRLKQRKERRELNEKDGPSEVGSGQQCRAGQEEKTDLRTCQSRFERRTVRHKASSAG